MFHISSYFIHPLANVWQIVNIVPLSTGCAGNLNRKARIAKVRFLTAVHGTSWQSIVDGPRWKRVLSYHELYELKFAPTDFIRAISAEKLDSFRLDFVSVSDQRRSVINDYLILGDPGEVSLAGRKGATKVFKQRRTIPTLTGPFPTSQTNAGSWLGTKKSVKKCFVLLCRIDEPHLLSSFREFVYDGYYLATVARFVHQAFLTRNEGTTDESKNVSDAISRSNSICTEKILFLTDHNVS